MAMKIAKNAVVSVKWSVTDEDGKVLEQYDIPIHYLHGSAAQALLPELEEALVGRSEGDELDVRIDADKGYWPHDPSLSFTDDLGNVPDQFRQLGAEVQMSNESGEVKTFRVTHMDDTKLTVDANHPFADKTVIFHVTVLAVRAASKEELMAGKVDDGAPTLH